MGCSSGKTSAPQSVSKAAPVENTLLGADSPSKKVSDLCTLPLPGENVENADVQGGNVDTADAFNSFADKVLGVEDSQPVEPAQPAIASLEAEVAAHAESDPIEALVKAQDGSMGKVAYESDELAEVKIIEGIGTGNWVKCRILGPGSSVGMYNIHVLPTTDYNNVDGLADTDVSDISTEYLRKAGDYSKAHLQGAVTATALEEDRRASDADVQAKLGSVDLEEPERVEDDVVLPKDHATTKAPAPGPRWEAPRRERQSCCC